MKTLSIKSAIDDKMKLPFYRQYSFHFQVGDIATWQQFFLPGATGIIGQTISIILKYKACGIEWKWCIELQKK